MTVRKVLVQIGGRIKELASGDTVAFNWTPWRWAPASGAMDVGIDVVSGSTADFTWLRGGVKRWQFRLNTTAEGVGNVGSDLDIRAFTDAGGAVLAARWNRATQVLDFAATPTINGVSTALIASSISNGDTTHSPSGDAVFDALALKGDLASTQTWTGANTFQSSNTAFYSVSDSDGPGNSVRRQRATGTGALASGDRIGFYNFQGYNGSGYPIAASMESYTLEAFTGTANGAKLAFFTCAAGAVTRVRRWEMDETALYPFADNTYQGGKAGARIKEIFCANATINTSDAREKSEPRHMTATEIAVAQELALLPCVFKWKAAIAEKGEDAARWHVSPTVQAVIAVFQAHGLDPFAYGMVCYDQWEETREPAEYETVELEPAVTVDHPAIYERTQLYTEAGQPERFAERLVSPAWTEVVTPAVTEERLVRDEIIHSAGDRYSLRGGELAHFIAAGTQAWLTAQKA
jgi:hypothetical protein